MSLIVEDGTGLPNAESYCSVAEANDYHAAIGNAAWAGLATDTLREENLRKATLFMRQLYRMTWQGKRTKSTQALDWPRYDVEVDDYWLASNIVPVDVKNACAELALKAISGPLVTDLTQGVKSKKVGPIETVYDDKSPRHTQYLAVDRMLGPYLNGGGSSTLRVSRA